MRQPKQPPAGVETTPHGTVVPLREAARVLRRDHRSLINAIKAGTMRGGAIANPQRLRWYVYADELTKQARPEAAAAADSHDLRAEIDGLCAQYTDLRNHNEGLRAQTEDLRAQNSDLRHQNEGVRNENVSLMEANRILIATQQNLLDADQASVDKYRDLARSYLDALAQFMTPGSVRDLAGGLGADL